MKSTTQTDSAPPSPHSTKPAGWGELLGGRNGLKALALTGAVAMHAINVHIVTTVLPSVVREIGGLEWYAWNTTLFVVASIVGAALSVRVLAAFGARTAMASALLLFAVGTLLCAGALNMPTMLLGRTVQGLGGGTLAALSYTLIRMVFVPRLWPRAIALVSGMWGIATLSGPAVGGLFAQSGHWRWAFCFLLPLIALQMALVWVQLQPARMLNQPDAATGGIPGRQIVLLALSVVLVAAASVVPAGAWQAACVLAGLGIGGIAIMAERGAAARLLPRGGTSLGSPLGKLYAVITLLLMGTMVEIYVPYFLQHLHGLKPLTAGYTTALMAGGWSLASVSFSGATGNRSRTLMWLGPMLCLAGLALLAFAMPMAFAGALLLNAVALALIGLGVGSAWPHLLNAILHCAPPDEASAASAAISTVQLYGMAVGAALAGLFANALGVSASTDPQVLGHAALWLFAAFAIFPLLALVAIRRFLANH
ncbi:MAG: MFS transporter [Burkholderiaceae bacterium]|nr:MFS transporter [Burkholderiaceae bacterium]